MDNDNVWISVHVHMKNNYLMFDLFLFDKCLLLIDLIVVVFLYHSQYIIEDHYISWLD